MRRTALLATASALAFAAFAPGSAQAQCAVTTGSGSPGSPASGDTITCTSNLETDPILGAQASGVTVEVQGPSGGISVTGDQAILLGDDATIDIAGQGNRPVSTSGDDAAAITVGRGAAITVGGNVSTSGGNSGAITTGNRAQVDVTGTVTTGGGMSNAISVGANSTVTIGPRANVNSQNSMSSAVLIRGDNSTLTVEAEQTAMNGLQQGLVTTSSGGSNPVRVTGNSATVDVAGEVRSSSGDATAILVEGNDAQVTVLDMGLVTAQSSNSDAIGVTGTGATIRVEVGGEVVISSGNSSGIVAGEMGTVEIAGTVSASSSDSAGVVLGDRGSLTVEQGGLIETSSSESQAVLVSSDATRADITVATGGDIDAVGAQAIVDEGSTNTTVTVDGIVFGGSSDPVIDLRGGNDTVTVNGTVRGSSANPVISMGAGDDSTTINSSQTVEGPGVLVDAGPGNDEVNLASGQDFDSSQFTGVEQTTTRRNTTAGDPNQGRGTSINVSDDQSGGSFTAEEGGSVNVADGGSAGRISTNAGGRATVRSGGSAGVDADSGGDGTGTITFTNGSTANVEGLAQGGDQSFDVAGADFRDGTSVSVANSAVLEGSASGGRVTLALPEDAFGRFGAASRSTASFGAAVDAAISAGDADASELILSTEDALTAALSSGAGEDRAQVAAGGVVAALAFGEVLDGRAAPRLGGAASPGTVLSSRGLPGSQTVAWAEIYGGGVDGEDEFSTDFDVDYAGLAVGVEREMNFGGFGTGRAGIAIAATDGDTGSVAGDGDFDALSIGIYANAVNGPAMSSVHLGYTSLDFDLDDGASGSGDLLHGRVEYAYDLRGDYEDGVLIAPYGALGFVTGDIDGGATTLGTLADGEIDQGIAEIGIRLGRSYDLQGRPARGIIEAGYERTFGDDGVTFAGTAFGQPFTTVASGLGEDRLRLGLAWEAEVSPGATVSLRYDGRYGDGDDHRFGLGVAMKF